MRIAIKSLTKILILALSVSHVSHIDAHGNGNDKKDKKENHGNSYGHDKKHWGGPKGISLFEIQHMDFGIMPSGSKRCVLKSNQNLQGDCVGRGILGEIQVTGDPYYAYNVKVRSIGWVKGKRLVPRLATRRFLLDRRGRDQFNVRGALSFKDNFNQTGTLRLQYIITVMYQ